jgi:glycosyltransferase involved in cell wall biosynthesis
MDEAPLRVLHLIAPVAFGGGEALLSDLIARPCDGIVESVVTIGRSAALDRRLDEQGTPHRTLGRRDAGAQRAGKQAELRRALSLVGPFRRAVGAIAPDVVHAHGFPASFLAGVCSGRRPALVYTHHYERSEPGSLERRALTLLFDRFDLLTTPADHLSATMNRFFPDVRHSFETLGIAVPDSLFDATPDPRWRQGLDDSTALAVCVGRLISSKNQRLIIEAFRSLDSGERPDLAVLLVGDGPDGPDLRREVERAGLEQWVRFAGHIDHERMPGLLAGADFAVFPTLTEASSVAAAEALACGLPILALDIPSMRETVGPAGILCPAGEFARGLVQMATEHASLSAAARRRAEHLRVSQVKPTWCSAYRRARRGD